MYYVYSEHAQFEDDVIIRARGSSQLVYIVNIYSSETSDLKVNCFPTICHETSLPQGLRIGLGREQLVTIGMRMIRA